MVGVPDDTRQESEAREWALGLLLAAMVLAVGLFETSVGFTSAEPVPGSWPVALGIATAVVFYRRAPGLGLFLVWLSCLIQVYERLDVMVVELATAIIAFGTARYGSRTVLLFSGLSLPIGGLIAVGYVLHSGTALIYYIYRLGVPVPSSYRVTAAGAIAAGLFCFALLAVPWLTGLVIRSRAQATRSRLEQERAEQRRSQAEFARAQAQEVAGLRAEQARLARDVHDVVGHSLAVILAQAESAQFLDPGDTERIQQTMHNIATSARQSLRDVRQVLSSTDGAELLSFDELINGVRAAGHEVRSSVLGAPWPLPHGTDAVAFRVLQEMLTNALKHGRRTAPIEIEQDWQTDLRIEVRNAMTPDQPYVPSRGLGLDGMRRRLETVRGRLQVGPRGDVFVATAWIPVAGERATTPAGETVGA